MKKTILLAALFFCKVLLTRGQGTEAEYSKLTDEINVVVLNLTGNTLLQLSGTDIISISSTLSASGKIIGLKFPYKRPDFRISGEISNDTLYIRTPYRYSPASIGYSSYTEKIENIIRLSSRIKILAIGGDILKCNEEFRKLEVISAGNLEITLRESAIKELRCSASDNLKINNEVFKGGYTLKNSGINIYKLEGEIININLIK